MAAAVHHCTLDLPLFVPLFIQTWEVAVLLKHCEYKCMFY